MKNKGIHVSIGMPIYKADKKFLDEAIQSILDQSWQNFDVVMSVDNNDKVSAQLCEKYLTDSRFKLHMHNKRLGWLNNIAWLMKQQEGNYWFYHQQDDMIKSNYIKVLVEYAQKHSEASVVYCDISCFGNLQGTFHQDSVCGTPLNREIELLRNHLPAVAFRGLVKRDVIKKIQYLRDNSCNSFCCDTTWMATMARCGELHRVSRLLYRKRYHKGNTHSRWKDQTASQLEYAWATHCVDMFWEALPVANNNFERLQILKSAIYRLRSGVSRNYVANMTWSRIKKIKYIFTFLWILARTPKTL